MKILVAILITIYCLPLMAAKVITIGVASNFSELSTVSFNPFGGYFKDAVELAISNNQDLLKKSGIDLRLKEFDYGMSDLNVMKKVKEASESDVLAVIGYNYSSSALIAGPIHQKYKLPMISPSASANRLGEMGDYVHLGSFNNEFMSKTLARMAIKDLQKSKVLILTAVNCAYCVDLSKTFTQEFTKLKGTVVKDISLLQEDLSYANLAQELKKLNFDLVFIPNQELTSARLILALLEAGIRTTFLGADGWGNEGTEFFRVLKGKSFEGYSVTHWYPEFDTKKSKRFVREYLKTYKKLPNDTSVLAFDSMTYLINSIIKTENLTRETLNSTLKSIRRFNGVTGDFIWGKQKAPEKDIVVLKSEGSSFVVHKILKLSEVVK